MSSSNRKNLLHKNIAKIAALRFISMFLLIIPFITLFWQSKGISISDFFIIQGVFSITVALWEVPSGFFADILGRKKSIILGFGFGAIFLGIYAGVENFWHCLLIEMALGIGMSFKSGSDSALLFDTLKELGETSDYKKMEGSVVFWSSIAETIASVLGAILADAFSYETVFLINASVFGIGAIISFTLKEPERIQIDSSKGHINAFKEIAKFSVSGSPKLKWLLLYGASLSTATLTAVWYFQPFFKEVGLDLVYFGVVWGFYNLVVGITSKYSHQIEELIGDKRLFQLLPIICFLGFALLGGIEVGIWGLGFAVLIQFTRGMNQPITAYYINLLVPSDRRATIISIKSLLVRLFFAILSPLLGYLVSWYSLRFALVFCGVFFGVLSFVSYVFYERASRV